MKLSKLLIGIDYECLDSIENIEIENVQYDSRKVKEGDLFVCIKGFSTDGHKYAEAALKLGAAAILCEDEIKDLDCIVIKTENSRRALAVIAANFYGRPSEKIKLIGITGTNGKTTTTYMIKAILEKAGYKVGLVGTIANYIGNKRIDTHRTTPESLELQQLFYEMTQEKIDYCVMEVSSHSLVLDRVYGLKFEVGIFSNLTRDHLDFHKTFENYYNAKMILFKNSTTSVLNVDDEYGNKMKKEIKSDIITYAIDSKADYSVSNINMGSKGIQFDICHNCEVTNIDLKIPGRYNIYNALCAAIACKHEGIKDEYIIEGLKSAVVPGRCEIVTKDYDLGFEIIVDYAHSPDSLENILKTAREFTAGRLICVFGCGGDRDKTKRPIMGSIAAELSDIAIVTSDNPRSEEPMTIIEDIVAGIKKQNFIVVENRKEAIKKSIEQANSGDVIVIAGKGHEDYQEIKGVNYHFDEKEIIKEILDSYRR